MSGLYETGVLACSERQAALLRRRAAGDLVNHRDLDRTNIAEGIEDMASRNDTPLPARCAASCNIG